MQPDEARLSHMLEAAERCVGLWRDRAFEDLCRDDIGALATARLLEIVGEAAENVSAQTRVDHPEIACREIAGTRDRLAQGYFDVDLEVVWSIVTQDRPMLVEQLSRALEENCEE